MALHGALKTRIVYGANLNFRMLTDYLERLEKAGLLVRDGRIYKTTHKGRKYLERYNELKDLLGAYKNCNFQPENYDPPNMEKRLELLLRELYMLF